MDTAKEERRARIVEAAAVLLDAAGGRLNIVHLNKALFYLDLCALRDLGHTVSHATYIALDQGPVVAKYAKHLVGALEQAGVAVQEARGDARPMVLQHFPESLHYLAENEQAIARSIGARIRGWKASEISDLSHQNLGWIVARHEGEKLGRPLPIDLFIAMQQVMDKDPWMDEPLTPDTLAAIDTADAGEGEPW